MRNAAWDALTKEQKQQAVRDQLVTEWRAGFVIASRLRVSLATVTKILRELVTIGDAEADPALYFTHVGSAPRTFRRAKAK